jgi:hypothetical protein
MLTKHVSDLRSAVYYIAGLPEMVNAMRKLVTDSGVTEDNIRAEEFAGFKMNHSNNVPNHAWKRHVLLVAIVVAVNAAVIVHVVAADLLYKSDLGVLSFKNPLVYLLPALLLVVAARRSFR